VGLGILPYKKSTIKLQTRKKIYEMREKLGNSLQSHCTRELENSITRIKDSITPYTTFVQTENQKLTFTQKKMQTHLGSIKAIRSDIEKSF